MLSDQTDFSHFAELLNLRLDVKSLFLIEGFTTWTISEIKSMNEKSPKDAYFFCKKTPTFSVEKVIGSNVSSTCTTNSCSGADK